MTRQTKRLLIVALLGLAGFSLGRLLPWQELASPWIEADSDGLISPAWASHSNGRADAGPDQTVAVGETAVLDGSGTLSLAGADVEFFWSLISVPGGSLAVLDDQNAIQPSFVVDVPGDYVAELSVNAGGPHNSQGSQVTISTTNSAPVADSGRDNTVSIGQTVVLDGGASKDVDGDALTYTWTLAQVPGGSGATLDDLTAVKPSFFVDTNGTYIAALTVNDGTVDSVQAQVTLDTTSSLAVAMAGPDKVAGVGETLTLDAGQSSDPDGQDILASTRWNLLTRPSGSAAALTSGTDVRTSLTLDLAGTYLVQLEVDANSGQEDFDTLVVTTGNVPPTADAGSDQSVLVGSGITLDGGGSSDLNGDQITYSWSLLSAPSGSGAQLDDTTLPRPSFTADVAGTYVAQLIVSDGSRKSAPDTVVIDTGNSRPIAEAGPDPAYTKGTNLQLDATASSDADNDPLTYEWSVLKEEAGKQGTASISDPTLATPTFSANRNGLYVLQLEVDDGTEPSQADTLVISTDNARPTADAGSDLTIFGPGTVQLSGSGSSDGDNDPLSYQWALVAKPAGSAAVLSGATAVNPTFVTDLNGFYVAQLVVSDGTLDSAPDTVVIQFENSPPVADAGPDQTVLAGATAQLDGTGSFDPEMAPLTYSWQLLQTPPDSTAALSNPTSSTPSFQTDAPGTYVAELVVNDGFANSAPDTVTITADPVATPNLPPVLNLVGNQSVDLGTGLTIDLSATDANGDTLSFLASPLPLPDGASLVGATGLFTFTPDASQVGNIPITFIVSDGLLTDSEAVTITVVVQPGGITALSARLLDTNAYQLGSELGIENATIGLLDDTGAFITPTVLSDVDGNFTISNIPAGTTEAVLAVDSTTAFPAPDSSQYASFREAIGLIEGVTNVIERPVFLPRIDPNGIAPVTPGLPTTVFNPNIGVTMVVPADMARDESGNSFSGELSITEVPLELAPMALPEEFQPAILISIQPTGVTFTQPIPITFPNLDSMPAGAELDLYSLDPDTGSFMNVGIGQVSAGGSTIDTISGGVVGASWHFPLGPLPGFADGGPVPDALDPDKCVPCQTGSNTHISSGNLTEDHRLVSYRSLGRSRAPRFVYNSTSADPQPIQRSNVTIPTRSAVPNSVSARLSVAGIDQGSEVFTSTSDPAPLNENQDETITQAVQFDASGFETGSYPYRLMLTNNFSNSSVSSVQFAPVLVNNEIDSPFGAGWTLDGLQRLRLQADGSAVISKGDGGIVRFRATSGGAAFPDSVAEDPDFNSVVLLSHFDADPPADTSNSAHTINLIGGAAIDSTEAKFGDASVLLPGTAFNHVSVPSSDDWLFGDGTNVTPFTLEAWVRFNNLPTSGVPQTVIARRDTQARSFILNLTDIGIQFAYYRTCGSTFDEFTGIFSWTTGIWYHVAMDVDENRDWRAYVDGQQVAGPNNLPSDRFQCSSSQQLEIGSATNGSNNPLDGRIDDVRITKGVARYKGPFTLPSGGGGFQAPPGDFSTLIQNPDDSFTRTLKNGTRIEFDANGLQTAKIDRNGNATRYLYDAQGLLTKNIDPTNALADPPCATQGVSCFAYTGGKLASVTDPANRTTLFDIDGNGDLIKITDPDSTFRTFAYDARHRLASQFSKRNFETTYDYNFAGRNIQANLPDLSTRQVSPSETIAGVDTGSGDGTAANPAPYVRPSAVAATFTDGNGNVTTYKLDSFGAATEIVDALTPPRTTTIVRDSNGDPVSITAPNGAVTEQDYDSIGNLIAIREAVGDPLQRETTVEYEPVFNQITRVVDPEQQIDPLRGDTRFEYDTDGNLTKMIDAKGTETVVTYNDPNCPGIATGVTAASGLLEETTTSFDHDPISCELLMVTGPLFNVTTLEYDTSGNVITVTDANLHQTRFAYDSLNRITKQVDATNLDPNPSCGTAGVICFTYDPSGNLSTLTDANGNATGFNYDSQERLVTRTDSLLNGETFQYDSNGSLRFATDRNSQTIEFQYDEANRRSMKIMLPGTVDEASRTFGYDASDNLLSIADNDSALTMTYDLLNRLRIASTTGAPAQPNVMLTYDYDRNDNRKTMDDDLFGITTYVYDALNRLDLLTNPSMHVADVDNDALGRRILVMLSNGASTSRGYDLAGRLTSVVNTVNTATVSSFTYTHDAAGNRKTLTQTRTAIAVASPLDYIYDELNQIKDATHPLPASPVESFTYDPAGNRLSRDGQVANNLIGAGNQLLEDEQFCYDYDLNGNLMNKTTKVAGACTGEVTSYSFDPENRLVRIEFPNLEIATYRYDGLGRRIEKNVNGVITRYIYDGDDILLEHDESGNLMARYTHGPSFDDPLILERDLDESGTFDPSERFDFHSDGLGSITEITDSLGSVARSLVYDSYGQIAQDTGGIETPYAYTGRELDQESGLFFYRARYYDPKTGRFLSEDPIEFDSGDVNLFRYVSNNPVNLVDPDGLAHKKYETPPNPNKKKGADSRKPGGERERNVAPPGGEEHSRRPKKRKPVPSVPIKRLGPLMFVPSPLCSDPILGPVVCPGSGDQSAAAPEACGGENSG